MTAAERVVVVGDALIDEIRDDSGVREFVGGAALNVAVGLARLGLPTTLLAMVGDDDAGARIRSYLDDYGVELIATPSPRGSSRAVSTRVHGEPVYAFNAAAKARRILFGQAERAAIGDAAIVVVSCFPFDDEEQTAELAGALAEASGLVAIDANPRAGMMRGQAAFVRGFEWVASGADLVKVGDDDAELLYGIPLDALAGTLLASGSGAVLATRGAEGASVLTGDLTVSCPIAEAPGPVVDTMGAGDSVLSSAVHSLMAGVPRSADEWSQVLRTAMDVAAATCRFEGALLRLPSASSGLGDRAAAGS